VPGPVSDICRIPHSALGAADHLLRVLGANKTLLDEGDRPDAPAYVRDQTPLRIKGEISAQTLRNEFRKAPKLSVLLDDGPLLQCIRDGIEGYLWLQTITGLLIAASSRPCRISTVMISGVLTAPFNGAIGRGYSGP